MKSLLLASVVALGLGCASRSSYVQSPDAALGRVVVYRNGIAYFERTARIEGDVLKLSVPADKVDDFLKSLTVVDVRTGEPPPISYPTGRPSAKAGMIDMEMKLSGPGPHELRLSYVTETPSWKPSYRLVVGDQGKVRMQAWAVVDNTSGEDWKGIRLGVGASSALSFRYDLQSVRLVQRETLHSDDLFAQAPPTGGASYGGNNVPGNVLGQLSDATIDNATKQESVAEYHSGKKRPAPVSTERAGSSSATPAGGTKPADGQPRTAANLESKKPPVKESPPQDPGSGGREAAEFDRMAEALKNNRGPVTIEGYADRRDQDKTGASLERANRVRAALVRRGVSPEQVTAVGNGEVAGQAAGVRLVAAEGRTKEQQQRVDAPTKDGSKAAPPPPAEPIGTSHFESKKAMDVPRGSSALISILDGSTKGEVVYLYDPDGVRGNATFPFRSVRVENPTNSTLESGPVTVFGQGRFIGEGIFEPIPARSVGFVPFALDRQVVIEREGAERDEISRILAVQRGVLSTEVQHTRKVTLTLHNRLAEPAVVYVKHVTPAGYKLSKGPSERERLGGAHLFRLTLAAHAKSEVVIEDATPIFKTADLRSSAGMDLVKVYLSSSHANGPLKEAIADLVKRHQEVENVEEQLKTKREQMDEFRARMDELHAQVVTLRAVRTQGAILRQLEKKLGETSDKVSQATVELVTLQERLMLARIRFQDGVAELSLDKAAAVARTGGG